MEKMRYFLRHLPELVRERKDTILALSGYTLLSIIFTYPVAFSLNSIIYGADTYQCVWYCWWFKTAFLNHMNLLYTPFIFYPDGVSLVFSSINPVNSVLSIPLQELFGVVPAYNLLWIFSFLLSGFGAFVLVRYLTGDSRAAFVSGLIFMFCPYRFAHALGHMNLITTGWIPFYILFLIKTVREKNHTNAVFAGIFLFLVAMSDYYYLIYMVVFTALFLLYSFLKDSGDILNQGFLKKIGIMFFTFIVVFSPFIYAIVRELAVSGSGYLYLGGFVYYSADILGFIIPSELNPLFRDMVSPIYRNFTGNMAEYTVFMGFTVIFLAGVAVLRKKTSEIKFWLLSCILFMVLCLGPILHVNGMITLSIEGYPAGILLPYVLLMKIPLFSVARVPSRWDIMVMLCLAVLAGYGLTYLFSRYEGQKVKRIAKNSLIGVLVSSLILIEFLAIPYPVVDSSVPAFYHQIAGDTDDYAILELPEISNPRLMYYQTVHQKKIVNGYVSRTPDSARIFMGSTPFISHLIGNFTEQEDIINKNLPEIGPSVLNYYNIRYVILHQGDAPDQRFATLQAFLQQSLNNTPEVYENNTMFVYRVEEAPGIPFVTLNSGWHGLEGWSGMPSRWMTDTASFTIYSERECPAIVHFEVLSFYRPRTLEIRTQSQVISGLAVPDKFIPVEVPVNLQKGENVILLHVPEGSERAVDIPELSSSETGALSVAVRNITISEFCSQSTEQVG